MPGLIGIYPFGLGRENWRLARFVYYGLLALQHRGQEFAAIITYGDEGFHRLSGNGFVDEVFTEDVLNTTPGFIGIGYVTPSKDQHPVFIESPVRMALIGDGKPSLGDGVQDSWRAFGELFADEASRTGDSLKAARHVIEEVDGGYSFIVLTENQELIAGRDVHGVKPLEIGSLGFDVGAVVSESSALDVLGMEYVAQVKPGEVIRFDPYSIEKSQAKSRNEPNMSKCSFEYVYLARPDSIIDCISVYSVREKIGMILAKERSVEADIVIGIPEAAIPFSLGYSMASGIPASLGFVTTGRKVRTAIKPSIFERLVGVQLKLNPIRCAIDGRDVVLIDDSVVRGTTLRNTVWNMKRRGARRIHVRIGSPAIMASCPYGIEIPPPDELIARALDEREIAEVVGADSFAFLSIDGLCKAIGLKKSELCLKCWGCEKG
ncbi:MAG: amidophosphoribosyltransferase [Thaumarchaeota archaeon]|jgi:amidophosphoribosyltransferase|nr:amidophosphoribosyltransferase [Candidatus Terraquivivens yellowstonensis]